MKRLYHRFPSFYSIFNFVFVQNPTGIYIEIDQLHLNQFFKRSQLSSFKKKNKNPFKKVLPNKKMKQALFGKNSTVNLNQRKMLFFNNLAHHVLFSFVLKSLNNYYEMRHSTHY